MIFDHPNSRMAPEIMIAKDNKKISGWNVEDGYSNKDSHGKVNEVYPNRVLGNGNRAGLLVAIQLLQENMEYMCRGPIQGFKFLLHMPGEVPQISKYYYRVPLEQEVIVQVKPNMITTSKNLRDYKPNQRQCYFSSERQLRFFKIYTQRNCELECLANFTKTKCGCVKFSSPSKKLAIRF